jgi:hypothetical protein
VVKSWRNITLCLLLFFSSGFDWKKSISRTWTLPFLVSKCQFSHKDTAVKPDWIKRNKPLDFFQSNPDEKNSKRHSVMFLQLLTTWFHYIRFWFTNMYRHVQCVIPSSSGVDWKKSSGLFLFIQSGFTAVSLCENWHFETRKGSVQVLLIIAYCG